MVFARLRQGEGAVNERKLIQLRSGGWVSVIATIDLAAITPEDIAFIGGIAEAIQRYEREANPPTESKPSKEAP
jgi:hypothetical protein